MFLTYTVFPSFHCFTRFPPTISILCKNKTVASWRRLLLPLTTNYSRHRNNLQEPKNSILATLYVSKYTKVLFVFQR